MVERLKFSGFGGRGDRIESSADLSRILKGDSGPRPPTHRRWSQRTSSDWRRTSLALSAWIYLGLVIAMWLMLRLAGDRWWPATLLTFGPRWMVFLPMPLLAPLAAFYRRRSLVPLTAAALFGIGPAKRTKCIVGLHYRSSNAGDHLWFFLK